MEKNQTKKSLLLTVIFILYMAALITMVLFKYGFRTGLGSLNFIPFQFIKYPTDTMFKNIFGNIVFFVPFGLLFPLMFCKMNTWKTILAGFILSLLFEITQYVTDTGGADVDDLILNTCGVILGALFFLMLRKYINAEVRLRKMSLIFAIVFGVIASAIFLFV